MVGSAVKRTESSEDLKRLVRIYWFTIEFGVVREMDGIKAYGAGLLSSAGELAAMGNAEMRPFDLDAVAQLNYDTTKFQPILFCADSFEAMYHTLREHLLRWQ